MSDPAPFFLFLGSTTTDAAVSKLKASGVVYEHKRLESGPENWARIAAILRSPSLAGVVAKLTAKNFRLIAGSRFREPAEALFSALARTSNVVFVHEAILGDLVPRGPLAESEIILAEVFEPPSDEVRGKVLALLDRVGIVITPYRTNAELSVLTAAFVDDNESSLLFRVYVPRGRLYAAEGEKLLGLFRDWLREVKRARFREDGYATAHGRVYEFFGDGTTTSSTGLAESLGDFARFLELCVSDPRQARRDLGASGIAPGLVDELVSRYGKEGSRLSIDVRHARETRLLSLRQRLESELLDASAGIAEHATAAQILDSLVPDVGTAVGTLPGTAIQLGQAPAVHVTLNQQFIRRVEGMVIQDVSGSATLGADADALIELVRAYGGTSTTALETAVHEIEDPEARYAERLGAKQRLKTFLIGLSGKVEDHAVATLWKYLEGKMGV